jgi:hypothetical protein
VEEEEVEEEVEEEGLVVVEEEVEVGKIVEEVLLSIVTDTGTESVIVSDTVVDEESFMSTIDTKMKRK